MRNLKMSLYNDHIMVGDQRITLSSSPLDPIDIPATSIEAIDAIKEILFTMVAVGEIVEDDTVRLDECRWFGLYIPQITLIVKDGMADFSVQAGDSGKRLLNAARTQDTINLALNLHTDVLAMRARSSISSVVQWSFGTCQEFVGYFAGPDAWSIRDRSILWLAMQIRKN